MGPRDVEILRVGLTRALLDIDLFLKLSGVVWDARAGRPDDEESLPQSLKDEILEHGLTAVSPGDLARLAISPNWLAELKDAIDTCPSSRWLDQLDLVFPEENATTSVLSQPSSLLPASTQQSSRDDLPLSAHFSRPASTPAEVVRSRGSTTWTVLVPIGGVEWLSEADTAVSRITAEFTQSEDGGEFRLEVRLDPLPLTRDAVCHAKLITAEGEIGRAEAKDRRLTFLLPVVAPSDAVLEGEYQRGETHLRFHVTLGQP
jgi:hypothetical protein